MNAPMNRLLDESEPLPARSARLMRLATYASTSVAGMLILAKLIAWVMTDSVSLMATLLDSCLDALASIINLLAVRHALMPADAEHRFGHGKAEALAGLGQSTFIAGSAVFLILEAVSRLLHPVAIEALNIGVAVMLFSILATIGLMLFQRHVIRETGSTAIKADYLHYKTDLLVNAAVLVALVLSVYGWPGMDPLFAFAIAGYILYSAWEIVRESLDHLMDKELPEEERGKIKRIVEHHPQARGMHDLRTRKSGTTSFIQFHLELEPRLNLLEAHAIADEVEAAIRREFGDCEVIIHEDPAGLNEGHPDFASRDD